MGGRYRSGHQLLAEMPPEEWDYWRASDALERWSNPWEPASMIATQIINAIQGFAAGMGGGRMTDDQILPDNAFVPGVEYKPRRTEGLAISSLRSIKGLPE